jgi:hypothetical protein
MMTHSTEGFDTAYEIRKDNDLKFTPILMLTSVNEKSGHKFNPETDGEFLPVDGFIEKPVEPVKLDQYVSKLLNLKKEDININGKKQIL